MRPSEKFEAKAAGQNSCERQGWWGFQLLGMQDFSGQWIALIGVLDAFWDSKGYVTAEEYSRFCGPAWLSVAADGTLSGTPTNDNVGPNEFVVSVADGNSGSDQAALNINVLNLYDGQLGMTDFAGFAENWLISGCGYCSGADLTGDSDVDLDDLALFGQMWLTGF